MATCDKGLNDGIKKRQLSNDFLRRIFSYLRWEVSEQEKCCCCLPLRPGFLVLAYLKLTLNVALFFYMLRFLLVMYKIFSKDDLFKHGIAWTAICIDVADIVIGVVFIVSAYKKNQRLMEIYYKYSIYIFGLLSVLSCIVFHFMYSDLYAFLIIVLIFILLILMQVYLIKIVKMEVLELSSIAQFQVLNNDDESLCRYVNNIDN